MDSFSRDASSFIVSNWTDASFGLGVAYHMGQRTDISDLISLKTFPNSEFCPRFLVDEHNLQCIGKGLAGKCIYIISTSSPQHTRSELALRNLLIANAAKENGAARVVLVEPDLFFSAQDRGPHFTEHPQMHTLEAQKKFDGQPFSAQMYASMLRCAGIDQVVTVHNHKPEVMAGIYKKIYAGSGEERPFINLDISYLVASFILNSGTWCDQGEEVGFLAPDQGAEKFVNRVREASGLHAATIAVLEKKRLGSRNVTLSAPDSMRSMRGRHVFILDDMVRTGGTIRGAVELLTKDPQTRPAKISFYCTHTYISQEARENLNSPYLNEFITANTLPSILNRDDQGRLRNKIVVMKVERWIADALVHCLEQNQLPEERYGTPASVLTSNCYQLEFSSRNLLRNQKDVSQQALALGAR